MIKLPLYPTEPLAAVEREPPLVLNHHCRRCSLGAQPKNRTVCMPADGEPGGLLVVSERISVEEDAARRPVVGAAGTYLRGLIKELWPGPVVYDTAVRCHMSGEIKGDKLLRIGDRCRGYLAQTVVEVSPSRVVALGSMAAYGVLGRTIPPWSARRGYGWLMGDVPTPVYLNSSVYHARKNRFHRQWFEADMEWALRSPILAVPFGGVTRVVRTEEDAEAAHAELLLAKWAAFDCEAAGRTWEDDYVLLAVTFCARGAQDAWTWDEEAVRDDRLRTWLIRILYEVPLAAHSAKYDLQAVTRGLGIPMIERVLLGEVAPPLCTLQLRRMLDSYVAHARLEVSAELVGMGGHKKEADDALNAGVAAAQKVVKERAAPQMRLFSDQVPVRPIVERGIREEWNPRGYGFATVPVNILLRYNARDTVSDARLCEWLETRMDQEPRITKVWQQITRFVVPTFAQMEQWGVGGSREAVDGFSRWLDIRQQGLLEKLEPYNIGNLNSDDDKAAFLYDRLRLPCPRITPSGKRSTDADSLAALEKRHPVVAALAEWDSAAHMRSNFADGGVRAKSTDAFALGRGGMLQWLCPDRRFHPSYKPEGTQTGRPSCESPNLYNLPRPSSEGWRGQAGKMSRNMFRAPDGYVLIEADQSQVELRAAADLSGDPKMKEIFVSGIDFHYRTAQIIAPHVWKMKAEDVPKKGYQRDASKTTNFALAYGKGDFTLACDIFKTQKPTNEQVEIAAQIKQMILGSFTVFAAWLREQVRIARETGRVWTWWNGDFGRARWVTDVADRDEKRAGHGERQAMNAPVQGYAAEFTLASLVSITQWILEEKIPARVVLTVYDSILIEAREDVADEVAWQLKATMERWPTRTGVPLVADLKRGKDWGTMTDLKI